MRNEKLDAVQPSCLPLLPLRSLIFHEWFCFPEILCEPFLPNVDDQLVEEFDKIVNGNSSSAVLLCNDIMTKLIIMVSKRLSVNSLRNLYITRTL